MTSPSTSPPINQDGPNRTNTLGSWGVMRAWEISFPCFKESYTIWDGNQSSQLLSSFPKCHDLPILFGKEYFCDSEKLKKCIFTNLCSQDGDLSLPYCVLGRVWIFLCMKWVLHPGPGWGGPCSSPKGRVQFSGRVPHPSSTPKGQVQIGLCFCSPHSIGTHLSLVLFPVQQVIENHILKLFQSNLVPADPE